MSKIKILHVTGTMNRGGAEIMLMDLFRNVSDHLQFDFLVNFKKSKGIEKGDFDDEIIQNNGRIAHIPAQWDIGPQEYITQFKNKCKLLGEPDIVHIHMNMKSGIIALAAKKSGIKHIIVHSHANLTFRGSLFSAFKNNLELAIQKKLIMKYASYYWGCSKEANLSLFSKSKLTPENSEIINNAIDIDKYIGVNRQEVLDLKTEFNLTDKTIILGNIGRIVKQKNVLFIIEVLNKLNRANFDFVFVFAGRAVSPEYLQEIMCKIEEYKLQNRVKYLGLREDIPALMSCFDVFLGPSIKEGFGMVAIEAQAAGTPCILYKDFPSTVDMNLGLVQFLDDFNIENWLNAIKEVDLRINDKDKIRQAFHTKGFDIKENTKLMEKMYSNIMKLN